MQCKMSVPLLALETWIHDFRSPCNVVFKLACCGLLLKGNGWEQNIMQSGDDQSLGLMILLIQSCQETRCVYRYIHMQCIPSSMNHA